MGRFRRTDGRMALPKRTDPMVPDGMEAASAPPPETAEVIPGAPGGAPMHGAPAAPDLSEVEEARPVPVRMRPARRPRQGSPRREDGVPPRLTRPLTEDDGSERRMDLILAGAAFALFFLTACHRLSFSSLWFDEAIEYWYSKVLSGTLPFSQTTGMYERVVSTLQPPLYNFLMYLWLHVSDTVWWFRFFGVICGAVGMAGLWKGVRKAGGGGLLAAGSVCFCACCYRLVFYWQEAAEYCLLLGSLFVTLWFWIRLVQDPDWKGAVLFTVSAVVPVYSQYGAAFPVAALALTALVCVLLGRDLRTIGALAGSYAAALLFAALPLWQLYLSKQIGLQHGGGDAHGIVFENGFVHDGLVALHSVFRWLLTPDMDSTASRLLMLLLLLALIALATWGGRLMKALIFSDVLAWLLYFFAVEMGIYADMSYGGFGNRYSLCLLPMWIVTGAVGCLEAYRILGDLEARFPRIRGVRHLTAGIAAGVVLCSCLASWHDRIAANWSKDDIREVVAHWYAEDAASKDTLVYYAADGGFSYYVRMDPAYDRHTEDRIHYMRWYNDRRGTEYRAYLNGVWGASWPREVYLAADHYNDDLFAILDQFYDKGYARDDIYNKGDGVLLHLSRNVR